MVILGIHDGHNSGATLLADGVVLASVSEERLTRSKNEMGYPRRAIDDVLRIAGCDAGQVDAVVYASNFMHSADHLRRALDWYRAGEEDQARDQARSPTYLKAIFDIRRRERVDQVREHLGGKEERISFLDHHLAHAAAAYFGSGFGLEEPVLVLTCDGAGDGFCATVSVGRHGRLDRIAATKRAASLGKIYSRVTYALGLTPWEHEYKVMGLAPYADPRRAVEISKIFRELVVMGEDRVTFRTAGTIEASYSYPFLRSRLERLRFDEISGGVQLYTEEMLCEWVEGCVQATGIGRVACGGGVFMNVKANLRISQLDCVEEMFVFPSCGDESLSFGAAWHEYYRSPGARPVGHHLPDVYLGGEFTEAEITRAMDQLLAGTGCLVRRAEDIEGEVAGRLADDEVVARFAGRMEWGARALGNRSILANPREWRNVEKINSMIKMRDFWMPFAPSMIAERTDRYVRNPKGLRSPFMMFAFETDPSAAEDMGAALHPRDKTARVQFVEKETNPRYWSLLDAFERRTGVGAVLNTSFNMHGFPLVYSPAEAIDVFLRSGLDHLALEHHLVSKPSPQA